MQLHFILKFDGKDAEDRPRHAAYLGNKRPAESINLEGRHWKIGLLNRRYCFVILSMFVIKDNISLQTLSRERMSQRPLKRSNN